MDNLDPATQITIEKELEKYKNGRAYDPVVLAEVVKKRCLGGYFAQGKPRANCRHYWETPEEKLSVNDRISLLELKKSKAWRVATLAISIIAIIVSLISIYIKSDQGLRDEISELRKEFNEYKAGQNIEQPSPKTEQESIGGHK